MTCTFCACFNYFDNSGKLQEDTFLSFQGEVLSTIEQFANSSDGFDQLKARCSQTEEPFVFSCLNRIQTSRKANNYFFYAWQTILDTKLEPSLETYGFLSQNIKFRSVCDTFLHGKLQINHSIRLSCAESFTNFPQTKKINTN